MARGWRAWAALAFFAIVAALPGFFSIPPLDRDESRFAQASAQMLETGDFLHVRLQDEPRDKKPIGIYWMQAASVAAFSDVAKREIWAWRIPSMLGAILATFACFWGGSALVGRRAAFIGASLLAVCVLLSTEAMIAKTDAMLCGATTLAMAALARIFLRLGGGRTAIVFWAALALGVLVKGPIAPMVAGTCIAALCVWKRDLSWLKPLLSPIGVAVAALILAPWLYTLSQQDGGARALAAMTRDIAPKLGGGGEHGSRPPGLHLLLLPLLIFPASLGLAPAAMTAWRTLRAPRDTADHDGVRFLIAWAAPTWLVFEIASTKLVHYTLPLYPAIALLIGAGLLRWIEGAARGWREWLSAGLLVGGGAFTAVIFFASTWTTSEEAHFAILAVCGGLLLITCGAFFVARSAATVVAAAIACGLLFSVVAREAIAPRADRVLLSRAAARALALGPDDLPALAVGYGEPSLVFALGTDTLIRDGAHAGREARAGQPALVEAHERAAFDAALDARGLAFEPTAKLIVGRDYSNGDFVNLQPGRVISDARN